MRNKDKAAVISTALAKLADDGKITIVEEDTSSQVVTGSREAERAAQGGWLSSRKYRRERGREADNRRSEIQVNNAETAVTRAMIARLQVQKQLLVEAGMIDQLPLEDRKKVELRVEKINTEITEERRKQAELESEIRIFERGEPTSEILGRVDGLDKLLKGIGEKLDASGRESAGTKKLTGIDAVIQETASKTQSVAQFQRAMEKELASIDQEKDPEAYERIESIWEDRMLKLLEEGK